MSTATTISGRFFLVYGLSEGLVSEIQHIAPGLRGLVVSWEENQLSAFAPEALWPRVESLLRLYEVEPFRVRREG